MKLNRMMFIMLLSTSALAESPPATPVPEQPDIPPPIESGQTLPPEINIIRRDQLTITEYRINGVLYQVKIVPDIGAPYYLVDSNGDGNLNVRRNDLEGVLRIPQWVIFSW